jgi:hypothetical protein
MESRSEDRNGVVSSGDFDGCPTPWTASLGFKGGVDMGLGSGWASGAGGRSRGDFMVAVVSAGGEGAGDSPGD